MRLVRSNVSISFGSSFGVFSFGAVSLGRSRDRSRRTFRSRERERSRARNLLLVVALWIEFIMIGLKEYL